MEEKIRNILKRYSQDEKLFASLHENSDLKNDLGVNSARVIDIILDLEEEFGITIEDQQITKIKTFKDIVEMVNAKTGSK